jgi:hypothetical protein
VLPPAEAVAAGWHAQADRGMRLVLPDDRLAGAVAAARRHLLLRPGGRPAVAAALDRYGYHDEAAAALAALVVGARPDGSLGTAAVTAATLVALGGHWGLARDSALASAVVEPVAEAVQWMQRVRRSEGAGGLLPPGPPDDGAGPAGRRHATDLWAVAGLRGAADVLAGAGQPEAAADARGFADDLWDAVGTDLDRSAERLGTPAVPARAGGPLDAGAAASLAACAPLGLLAAGDPRVAVTADAVREGHTPGDGRAVFHAAAGGLGPTLTMLLAGAELRIGDRRALDRLAWLLDAGGPTWAWPTLVHPQLGTGCGGDGHDVEVAAGVLTLVRDLLVREDGEGVALASLVPDSWYGQGWEVHGAPTGQGTVSYAVRWHGDRVALLWEAEPHPGAEPVRLTAPGLEPGWSTTDARGEALLGPVPGGPAANGLRVGVAVPPADPGRPPDDGGSFG